jgi:hypothetical protein
MTPALRTPSSAHVAPLAVFIAFTALVPLLAVENSMLPWWRHAPEQWVYPLQTVIVGILLWRLRSFYTFTPLRGFALAIVLGIIDILWWCLPALLWQKLTAAGVTVPAW